MARATPSSLNAAEQALLAETSRDALRALDEDALGDLLGRVRRMRDKLVQQHRREIAGQVAVKGSRAAASAPPRRSASKAEMFEGALARTSSALAAAARQAERELRAARIAASRAEPTPAIPAAPTDAAPTTGRGRTAPSTSRARHASQRATGARRQAKRDST